MAHIDIRPLNVHWRIHVSPFSNSSSAAGFAFGRDWKNWQLFINGRLYSWPVIISVTPVSELIAHIDHCIEIDESFYASD